MATTINRAAVLHIPVSKFAFALNEKTAVLRLRTAKNDVDGVKVFIGDRCCNKTPIDFESHDMAKRFSDELFDYYEWSGEVPIRFCYYFLLSKNGEEIMYYADRFTDKFSDTELKDGRLVDGRSGYYQYPYIMRDEIFTTPEWFINAVIYNIFPDSFANGKRSLSEHKETYTDEAGKPHRSMHGGTIRGVLENLDYIKDLGFNTVYLNPIFAAGEYHKYDIMDYFHIDPVLGTDEDFLELTDKVHELGMHIIIDGVFNHCGWQHPIFEDVIKKGEASEFKDFFYGLKFPVKKPGPGERPTYDCFAYEKRMPKLNTANPKVQEYFAKVGAYWVEKFHIDAWRLDVANEIDKNFWRVFRKAVSTANPETVLIGEVWEDATDWIEYDKMHSSMNYEFRRSCLEGIAQSEKTAGEFGDSLVSMYLRYSEPKAKAQMNLLDSHDVPRFLSLCDGDIKKMKAALAILFFFPGVPCMFYGDEFAIEGVKEHEYRMSPPWGEEPKLGGFIKELLKVRKEKLSPASSWARIETGENESVFGFERLQKEPLKVYINTGSEVCDVSELVSEGKVLISEGLCEGKLESFGFAILSC